jgi:Zn-dependent metalloprotease
MTSASLSPSRCPHRLVPLALGVALAMLSLCASAAARLQAPDAKRVAQAVSAGRESAGVELVARSSLVNRHGDTIVRATQSYQGHRVWGSEAVLRAPASGKAKVATSTVATDVAPAGSPSLTEAQAVSAARKAIGLKGRGAPPKVDLVVFPTKYTGDVRVAWNQATHRYGFDRSRSVMAVAPTAAYVWAYEVHLFANNKIDGVRDMTYVVDARTGAVLHVHDGRQNIAPNNAPVQPDTDVAAVGTGYSQWNGVVTVNTTQHADGTYAMIDRTRGSLYNPYLHDGYYDENGNQIMGADGNPISVVGLQSITETHDGFADSWVEDNWWFDGNATNNWGDGQQFVMFPYGGETSTNGQTAAVDAQFGMATTWDFYQNVFGRNGIDNQGTSPISVVHIVNDYGYYYDNAFWLDAAFGMFYSDGTRNAGVDPNTGLATTPDPNGFNSLTEIDIIGHEMTHGVTAWSDALEYDGESGGMNESSSDFMGSMVEAYATRQPGHDDVIPNTGTDWLMGASISDAPLRSMIHPSIDGVSADNWYAGIKYLDVHYSSGPLNRFFYFLAQGASSDKNSDSYSPYLPQGMAGIGNDHAARIWYTAMTEWLTPLSKYADARNAAINAATEDFGPGTPEVAAVKKAFAAINVGGVDDTPRVLIDFPVVHPGGGSLNTYGNSPFARMPIVAMGTTVHLSAEVHNTTDTRVTWQIGGSVAAYANYGFLHDGGTVADDGSWSPDSSWGFHAMTVASVADPLEYAEGAVWVIDGDADADTEFDAIDLGAVALSWGLDGWVNSSHSMVEDGFVDSMDVTAITEAFRNAFGGA